MNSHESLSFPDWMQGNNVGNYATTDWYTNSGHCKLGRIFSGGREIDQCVNKLQLSQYKQTQITRGSAMVTQPSFLT